MHHGTAVQRAGDWFGATVNVAARVSGIAHGGEVLLTDATREGAGDIADVLFEAHGGHRLRNVARPVKVFAAVAVTAVRRELVIDPVCRMAVNPGQATGRLAHEGRDYYLCSLECAARFAADPELYAKSEPLSRG
jgi:adenylate cyclase